MRGAERVSSATRWQIEAGLHLYGNKNVALFGNLIVEYSNRGFGNAGNGGPPAW